MGNLKDSNTRINVILDNVTLGMVDDYASEMGLNRSSAIRFICRQFLQNQKTLQSFTDMIDAYKAEQMKNVIEGDSVFRNPRK